MIDEWEWEDPPHSAEPEPEAMPQPPQSLLAVDLGLKTGLACFGPDGRLRWYRSHNLGSPARLRRAVSAILAPLQDLELLVIEGGGQLADPWLKSAAFARIPTLQVGAERWRRELLYPREQRSGLKAKSTAITLAHHVIAWSAAPKPTALRHDTAEAILLGLWACAYKGWLSSSDINRALRA